MKKHLLLTAALITATFSMNSFAMTRSNYTSIEVEAAATKSEAYANGHELISELKEASSFELSQELDAWAFPNVDLRSYEVDDASVTLVESVDASGATQYTPVVDVEYSYKINS